MEWCVVAPSGLEPPYILKEIVGRVMTNDEFRNDE
jgi:hypothetical protein